MEILSHIIGQSLLICSRLNENESEDIETFAVLFSSFGTLKDSYDPIILLSMDIFRELSSYQVSQHETI